MSTRHDAEELQRRAEHWRGNLGLTPEWAEALAALEVLGEDGPEEAETEPDDGVLFVAFRDTGDVSGMTPVADAGHLVTFDTWEAARRAAGALGVAAPQSPDGLRVTCKAHGLRLPRNGGNGRG